MINLDSLLNSKDIYLLTMVCSVKAMIFPSSHVWMWELDHKEGWAPKNWCLWIVVWRRPLKSPLDCKEIKPVNPKGNQSWKFIGRTDTPILWPPDAQSWLIRKDPDAGKDWRQEEKRMTEDEMVGWNHWFNLCEFEQAPEDREVQGGLACCCPWGGEELDMTDQMSSNKRAATLPIYGKAPTWK